MVWLVLVVYIFIIVSIGSGRIGCFAIKLSAFVKTTADKVRLIGAPRLPLRQAQGKARRKIWRLREWKQAIEIGC